MRGTHIVRALVGLGVIAVIAVILTQVTTHSHRRPVGRFINNLSLFGAHGSGEIKGKAPKNTVLPTITGEDVEGDTLKGSEGTWTGATAYAYEWERCNTSGESCVAIGGATAAAYVLVSADVSHTLRVVVTASNAGASATATSAATATVQKEAGTPTNCFPDPEGCGYPGPENSGVEKGVTLTEKTAKIRIFKSESGTEGSPRVLQNIKMDCAGCSIEDEASWVVIKNIELVVTKTQEESAGKCATSAKGGNAIRVAFNAGKSPEHVTIEHVTLSGGSLEGCDALDFAIWNQGGPTNHIVNSKFTGVTVCVKGGGTIENDYCLDNGTITGQHYDGVLNAGGSGEMVVKHDTIFQPHIETSPLSFFSEEAPLPKTVVENNFLAGGDYLIYGGTSHGTPEGPVIVKGNRFARCLTSEEKVTGEVAYVKETSEGNWVCSGGFDSHGYWPKGGSLGVYTAFLESITTWEGNYWDNNLAAVSGP